jgi:predicted nucleotidyltransferase
MSYELYIFGSATRGEVRPTSDIDVLVIPLDEQPSTDFPSTWSFYKPEVLKSFITKGDFLLGTYI